MAYKFFINRLSYMPIIHLLNGEDYHISESEFTFINPYMPYHIKF